MDSFNKDCRSMASRPSEMSYLTPHGLSQDRLNQLERSLGEPLASCKTSRTRKWVHTLGHSTMVAGSSSSPVYDRLLHGAVGYSTDMTTPTQYFFGSGQISIKFKTGSQSLPAKANSNRPDFASHLPVQKSQQWVDLTGNDQLSSKVISSPKNGEMAQPPSKKVFTEKHLHAPATTVHMTSISSASALLNAASHIATPSNEQMTRTPNNEANKAKFGEKVKAVFSDICETYLAELFKKYASSIHSSENMQSAIQRALEEILERSSYPKSTHKKRKRLNDTDLQEVRCNRAYYYPVVFKLLTKQFALVPTKTIDTLMKQHKTLTKTYIALYDYCQPRDASDYLARLHEVRDKHPPNLIDVLEHELQAAKEATFEIETAKTRQRRVKLDTINEEKHRLAGTLVECQCCFGDVPPNRIVPCEGEKVHFFCYSCIQTAAKTQVGLMHYELKCFDTSGCQAGFDKKNIQQALDSKLAKKLEDLQQMDEIAKARIEGLSECPFCNFKAICAPIDQDKEFNCLSPECGKVSCRLCQQETHIPLSCAEAKTSREKDLTFMKRHAVEEAMTQAFIRQCPKCNVSIIKIDGCNKLKCSKCGTLMCDVCKKNVTKDGYGHFYTGSCSLHETGTQRAQRESKEIALAEATAIDSILAENVNLDPSLLRVSHHKSGSNGSQKKSSHKHTAKAAVTISMPSVQQNLPGVQGQQLPRLPVIPQIPSTPLIPSIRPVPPAPLIPLVRPIAVLGGTAAPAGMTRRAHTTSRNWQRLTVPTSYVPPDDLSQNR